MVRFAPNKKGMTFCSFQICSEFPFKFLRTYIFQKHIWIRFKNAIIYFNPENVSVPIGGLSQPNNTGRHSETVTSAWGGGRAARHEVRQTVVPEWTTDPFSLFCSACKWTSANGQVVKIVSWWFNDKSVSSYGIVCGRYVICRSMWSWSLFRTYFQTVTKRDVNLSAFYCPKKPCLQLNDRRLTN